MKSIVILKAIQHKGVLRKRWAKFGQNLLNLIQQARLATFIFKKGCFSRRMWTNKLLGICSKDPPSNELKHKILKKNIPAHSTMSSMLTPVERNNVEIIHDRKSYITIP